MTHWLAKIGGWAFFGLNLVGTMASHSPHGFSDWMQTVAAGLAAIGIHAASSTDGSK
jgi:hypothetical protein